ncbi:hypothetical protein P5673_026218 [Acropora cervicornis]|uniref:Uncharacterized protein n=1 Tax=Acropora cervicornis TaxID=6130 RepID=A0AAD9UWS5_ACRCE|nr:hypothetical protein P5673_026218 [Acropora cervicornis]
MKLSRRKSLLMMLCVLDGIIVLLLIISYESKNSTILRIVLAQGLHQVTDSKTFQVTQREIRDKNLGSVDPSRVRAPYYTHYLREARFRAVHSLFKREEVRAEKITYTIASCLIR